MPQPTVEDRDPKSPEIRRPPKVLDDARRVDLRQPEPAADDEAADDVDELTEDDIVEVVDLDAIAKGDGPDA